MDAMLDSQIHTFENKSMKNFPETFDSTARLSETTEGLIKSLSWHGSIDEQMQHVIDILKLDIEGMRQREEVLRDITNALKEKLPVISITPFGSTMNGLGFTTADLDLFVKLDLSQISLTMVETQGIPKYKKLGNAIKKNLDHCKSIENAKSIFSPRLPLVKCTSCLYGFSIDLLFKRNWGVFNSRLIYHFMNSDSRLRKVSFIIKFWAKYFGWSGMSGKKTISSYSVILMIIFALQQMNPPVLPPICSIISEIMEEEDIWNFNYNLDLIPSTKNYYSTVELLNHFYNFYKTFDYENYIICPFLGYPISKAAMLLESDEVNPMLKMYMRATKKHNEPVLNPSTFCVQDMFELNFNTTSMFSCFDALRSDCAVAASICEKLITDPNASLMELFESPNYDMLMRPVRALTSTFNKPKRKTIKNAQKCKIFKIDLETGYGEWKRLVDYFKKYFRQALLLDQLRSSMANQEKKIIQYCTSYHFWHGRKEARKSIAKNYSKEDKCFDLNTIGKPAMPLPKFISTERQISIVLKKKEEEFQFSYEFFVEFSYPGIIFHNRKSDDPSTFGNMKSFFIQIVPKVYEAFKTEMG